jgi:phage terminase small subunit
MSPKLTLKQEAFCQAYIENGGNASDAYRKSYSTSKMLDKSIWEKASELLANVKVSSRVDELKASILKRHEVTVDRVIQEYSKLAFANMLDYVGITKDGLAQVDFSKLTRDQAAAILEIKVDRLRVAGGGEAKEDEADPRIEKVTFKLADKKGALDSLGKYLGIFVDRVISDNTHHMIADEPTEDQWTQEQVTAH